MNTATTNTAMTDGAVSSPELVRLSYGDDRCVCAAPKQNPVIYDGRLVVVRGENGAGKTTFLRHLYSTNKAVMLPMELEFPKHLRPSEIEALFIDGDCLGNLDVPEDRPWLELSAGNRQKVRIRVAVSCALSAARNGPTVLLLDEPSTALDEGAQGRLWAVLGRLAVEHSASLKIIVASHDRPDAIRCACQVETWVLGADHFHRSTAP